MGIEPRRAPVAARPLSRVASDALPRQLAFLRAFAIPEIALRAAASKAASENVSPLRALLAAGAVSETCYYLCLARHLGLPFVADWPQVRPPPDIRVAQAQGVALSADTRARWLIAPAEAGVEVLLADRARGFVPIATAITSPGHLRQLLCHRAQSTIVHAASLALTEARPRHSALGALSPLVAAMICLMLLALAIGGACGWRLQALVLGIVFLAGLCFRLLVCAEGLAVKEAPVETLEDRKLPLYTVLVPLKDEAGMVPGLLRALENLDYPRAKREILLLVEADDLATRAALDCRLPFGFAVIVVPPGQPRTKPRALNVGLLLARSELVTVYDAEDRPEPHQLRRAAARFARASATLGCLQARLVIDSDEVLLSRLFAMEYAVLFGLFNAGLARQRLPLALGGTSNHFRADVLRAVGGWDAWNVTEDADLGLRLARFGYACDMLDSVTREEAPSRLDVWFRQRRRWTKGWLQTLLVLTRDLPAVVRELGWRRAVVVTLLLTNLVTGPLLTPIFLFVVIVNLARSGLPTPTSTGELVEATLAFAVIAMGGVGTLWCGLLAARSRGQVDWRSVAAFLPYQLMIALAAWGGLIDLVLRPYHWHKTAHGDVGRAAPRHAARWRLRRSRR